MAADINVVVNLPGLGAPRNLTQGEINTVNTEVLKATEAYLPTITSGTIGMGEEKSFTTKVTLGGVGVTPH